jgi:hypothetical protein
MKNLLGLVVFVLACAEARPPDPLLQRGEMPPGGKQCIQREEVQQYLARVKELILDQWEFPPGIAADQRVDILFSIRQSGELGGVMVPDALTQEIEDSAFEAIHEAAPFPPLSATTACLSVLPIRASFSNPSIR